MSTFENSVAYVASDKNPIVVRSTYAKYFANPIQSSVFSQLMYWSVKMDHREFYKSSVELAAELYLDKQQVDRAIRFLKKEGFVTVKVRRANGTPTRHIKIDQTKYMEHFAKPEISNTINRDVVNIKSDISEISNMIDHGNIESDKSLTVDYQETTHKIKNTALEYDFSEWPDKPSPEIWADYKKHRKAKSAAITQTSLNMLGKELTIAWLAGHSVDECLGEQMARGWQSFSYEWLKNAQRVNGAKSNQPSLVARLNDRSWADAQIAGERV